MRLIPNVNALGKANPFYLLGKTFRGRLPASRPILGILIYFSAFLKAF